MTGANDTTVSPSAPTSPRSAVLLIAFGAVALVILLALGTWQVQRLAWKQTLLDTIEARMAAAPTTLAGVEARFAETGDVDYLPVRIEGTFVHERERHFFATWKGASGWYVYTPLSLDDGRALMVNRGFVPFDRKDAATRRGGQLAGRIVVGGLARNPVAEKPSFIVPDNRPSENIFYWKDLGTMAQGLDGEVLPFFVDAGDAPVAGGLPAGGVTIVNLPNSHLQYAITWYGLAAALVAVAGVWLWRRRGEPDAGNRRP